MRVQSRRHEKIMDKLRELAGNGIVLEEAIRRAAEKARNASISDVIRAIVQIKREKGIGTGD